MALEEPEITVIPQSRVALEHFFVEPENRNFLPPLLDHSDYVGGKGEGQCMSLASVEVMQAKLNLHALRRNEPAPPLLSVQQLVDATTPKPIDYAQVVLTYLKDVGLVSSEEYKIAPPLGQGHLKNIQGLRTHQILDSRSLYCGRTDNFRVSEQKEAIDECFSVGPLVGRLYFTRELLSGEYRGGIINSQNFVFSGEDSEHILTHAATILGFGVTLDDIPFWIMRNNWGTQSGDDGIFRIAMDLVPEVYVIQVAADENDPVRRRRVRRRVQPRH